MDTSPLKITLQSPKPYRINLNEQTMKAIGITTPLPYGTARLVTGTTAYWEEHLDYVPSKGEIVVYTDRSTIDGVQYPGVKIGDGKAFGVDLPFVGDDRNTMILDLLNIHVNDTDKHLVPGERNSWNNKVSCSIDGERLILEGTDYNG